MDIISLFRLCFFFFLLFNTESRSRSAVCEKVPQAPTTTFKIIKKNNFCSCFEQQVCLHVQSLTRRCSSLRMKKQFSAVCALKASVVLQRGGCIRTRVAVEESSASPRRRWRKKDGESGVTRRRRRDSMSAVTPVLCVCALKSQ